MSHVRRGGGGAETEVLQGDAGTGDAGLEGGEGAGGVKGGYGLGSWGFKVRASKVQSGGLTGSCRPGYSCEGQKARAEAKANGEQHDSKVDLRTR